MTDQLLFNFFTHKRQYTPSQESSPLFWIRQMRFVKSLTPEAGDEIRRMHFKKGLNILWSKCDEPAEESLAIEGSASGHAAGKTTFCRFIRYILGETTFGNRQVRNAIQQRFPNGYVLAEVFIKEKLWCVALPFAARHRKIARSAVTIDEFLTDTDTQEAFEFYMQELNEALLSTDEKVSFPTGKTLIPSHLLTWLTRDQEARYNNIISWRAPASDSQSPDLNLNEKTWLLRRTLDLTCSEEDDLLRREIELSKEKQLLDKNIHSLQQVFDNDRYRLKELCGITQIDFEQGLFELPTLKQIETDIDFLKQELLKLSPAEAESTYQTIFKLEASRQQAAYTQRSWEKLNDADRDAQKVAREIDQIKHKLEELRKSFHQSFCHLKEVVEILVKNFLGNHFSADIALKNRQINIAVKHRGERRSVAIETCKVLIFDIASLILSCEGRGHHPRFLLHDSPREADITGAVYQALFLSAEELERAYVNRQPAFQYIITTTAAPPQSLLRNHLIEPILDASMTEGRLLKTDL